MHAKAKVTPDGPRELEADFVVCEQWNMRVPNDAIYNKILISEVAARHCYYPSMFCHRHTIHATEKLHPDIRCMQQISYTLANHVSLLPNDTNVILLS
jgi:hypothetical protein